MPTRSIIVVGGSAGSVSALQHLAAGLPADLAATVLVAIHQRSYAESRLPEVLDRAGPLRARHAEDGEQLEHGQIYVARPDFHLLLAPDERIRLSKGPKENRSRPAIDPLFRSAAAYYKRRVIGVLLSGLLDDGTAGLWAIKDQGGVGVVQDPADAQWPNMPRSAMESVSNLDYMLPATQMGPLLAKLSSEAILADPEVPASNTSQAEVAMAALEADELHSSDRPGVPSEYACPDCHGTLFEIHEGRIVRFRCRTGHAYTIAALEQEQRAQVDAAIWNAFRSLEEYAALLSLLATRSKTKGAGQIAPVWAAKSQTVRNQAETLRQIIEQGTLDSDAGESAHAKASWTIEAPNTSTPPAKTGAGGATRRPLSAD
jgi:two-component system chemotaxis response regulator CheB